jgi:hypothetical protein
MCDFQKFHTLIWTRLSPVGLAMINFAQDGIQICPQTAQNGYGFDSFLQQYHKDSNSRNTTKTVILNHIIQVTGTETYGPLVNVKPKSTKAVDDNMPSSDKLISLKLCLKGDGMEKEC